MNVEQIKALGAPFRAAEVQVSLRKKVAHLVMQIHGEEGVAMDFSIAADDNGSVWDIGGSIVRAAVNAGLLTDNSEVTVRDLDVLESTDRANDVRLTRPPRGSTPN